jgi:enterochelin esterase-like enzyme
VEASFPVKRALLLIFLAIGAAACAPPGGVPAEAAVTVFPTFTPRPGWTEIPATTAVPSATPTFTALPSPSPTATPSTTPAPTADPCWQLGGSIEKKLLYTEVDPLPWEFRVYTPPCYDSQPERQYPILILIHGSTFTDQQWDRLGADETADQLIAAGETSPFIILMPRDRVWTEPDEDPFGRALVENILPWVEINYRTLPGRENRAIGGLSRGASWAVHLGLKHWQTFGIIGAHSLPTFLTDPARFDRWLEEIPLAQMPRIYLDIGEKDYLLEFALKFESLLTEKNIPHEWHLYSGRHEEAYWSAHVEEYLRWYARDW